MGTDTMYQCLATHDQKAVDEFISRLSPGSLDDNAFGLRDRDNAASRGTTNGTLGLTDMGPTMHAVLRVIILGSSQSRKAFRVLEGRLPPSLTILTPAVFHMPYLKV
jgi:hypothetical protein